MSNPIPIPPALVALFPTSKAAANFGSVTQGLDAYGAQFGLDKPHRLAHYLAQLAHESAGFIYDREVWGPTPAQAKYDTRADLGNTKAIDGDGKLYRGRTAVEITGKANYQAFRDWCRAHIDPQMPDFVADPDAVNADPWEGLAPIWFWTSRDLNKLADVNDIEQITKRVNGGLNGYADRLTQYTRIGLVLCGFPPSDVKRFQARAAERGLYPGKIDGDSGPQTRAAIHQWLAAESAVDVAVAPAPVVQAMPVPVAPAGAEKTASMRIAGFVAMAGPAASAFAPSTDVTKMIYLGVGLLAVVVLLWRGETIAARVRSVLASFDR